MARSKFIREANAKEISEKLNPRTWYLLTEGTSRHYPSSLEEKYQLALELLTKLEEKKKVRKKKWRK